jgi:phospholipid/cholesterol/gamma-HCH transport system ATP-binding protein
MEPAVPEALYEIRGLTKRYGKKMVLDGLDFEIHRGECLVILGRSGTGKSVTLRQLNGLEKPEAGSIRFDGTDLIQLEERELFPFRRRIAMLFQSGALFDSMNVLENVAFALREHTDLPEKEIREKVQHKLSLVKLKDVETKMPSDLSGGMRKRVALARSLALDPEMVLFDEPTTGLDPITAATIGKLMNSIQKELGVTSAVVTHDIPLARRVGDRIALLADGKFRFVGNWEEAERSDDSALQDFLTGREEEEHEEEQEHVA